MHVVACRVVLGSQSAAPALVGGAGGGAGRRRVGGCVRLAEHGSTLIPVGGNPYAADPIAGYWTSVRQLVRGGLAQR
jgi:hypothetical protein